jgi:hypothetical protein
MNNLRCHDRSRTGTKLKTCEEANEATYAQSKS